MHTDTSGEAIALPGPGFPLARASHLLQHLTWMRLCNRSDRTLFHRRRAVVLLGEHLAHDAATASYQELLEWQTHLLKVSINKVGHQTAMIRPYFAWLLNSGLRSDNPAGLLPTPRRRPGLPRPIPESSLASAIADAPARLLPWLLLGGWCGLRADEIASRAVDDFFHDPATGWWVRVNGKGGFVRDVPIPDFAWPAIAAGMADSGPAWRRVRGDGPVTGHHVSTYCCRYLHKIGIADTLHALRHRVGTYTYRETRDIRLVQELLGHVNLNTTRVYTRVSPQDLADAVNRLPAVPLPSTAPGRHLHVVPTPREQRGIAT